MTKKIIMPGAEPLPMAQGLASRRGLLKSGVLVGGLAALPACASATTSALPAAAQSSPMPDFPFDDPATNVRTMARLAGHLDPAKQGVVNYSGRAFAVIPGEPVRAIYGIEGMGSNRIQQMEDGTYRFLFSEFAVYTDLQNGEPLDVWTNPVTGETVDVWHQRNGPINFALRPDMNAFGAFDAVDQAPGFYLPWTMVGDLASFSLDVTSTRTNPLTPDKWPDESSGEKMYISEHSQYFIDMEDLANPALETLPYHAALQSQKPWHPWMMMGQRPGYVFTRMVARKIAGIDDLPAPVAAYAKRELAEFIDAPAEWTGAYNAAYAIYAKTMTPRSAR